MSLHRRSAIPNLISLPEKSSEFDLQAEIHHRLKSIGYTVRGEVSAYAKDSSGSLRRCRFDLVVFNGLVPVAIIETKTPTGSTATIRQLPNTSQMRKYKSFGIPVYFCRSFHAIEQLMAEI